MGRKKMTAADMHYAQQRKAHETAMWAATLHSGYARDAAEWAAFSSETNAAIRHRELNSRDFRLTVDGRVMGIYSGLDAEDAIAAMHRDAGYSGTEDVAEQLGKTVEQIRAEITVEAV